MTLNKRQYTLVRYMKDHRKAISNRSLSLHTGLPINVVTARMFELREMGMVEYAGRVLDDMTNRTVRSWKLS